MINGERVSICETQSHDLNLRKSRKSKEFRTACVATDQAVDSEMTSSFKLTTS